MKKGVNARLEKAIAQYKQGKISMGKAAEKAGITISEMMDKLAELGVPSKVTLEQHLQGLKNLESVLK